MKKIFVLLLCFALLNICLTSCGNQAILDPGNFNFKHVHIVDPNESHCFNITKWWDNDRGIEVRLENKEGMFCSEGTYLLFESQATCPYCK